MNAASNFLSSFITAALCATFAAASAAQAADGARPQDAPVPTSMRTRAEVLAELEIWREAGLNTFVPHEAEVDPFTSHAYQLALARYDALRVAPAFAQRVERIARERGEVRAIALAR